MSDAVAPRSVIGVDVGGTKTLGLRVAVEPVDGRLQVLDRERTASSGSSAAALGQIDSVIATLLARAEADGAPTPEGIGLGMAGFISREGVAISAPNTSGLVGVDVPGHLRARFGLPVVVDNDANCVALAARAEVAPDVDTMVAVTLGTGIGGGLIVGGALVRGANGFAGEPGHMVIDPDGPECPCGQRGCWERYASGNGLGRLAREAATAGLGDSLVRAAGSIEAIRGEHVTALLDRGDADATAVFTVFAGYVALGLANLIMLLDPDLIVIGGGLAAQGDRLADLVRTALADRFPAATQHRTLRLVVAPEGPDAGALGAAVLAIGAGTREVS